VAAILKVLEILEKRYLSGTKELGVNSNFPCMSLRQQIKMERKIENVLKFVVFTAYLLFLCIHISTVILFVYDVNHMVFLLTFLKWQIGCAWPAMTTRYRINQTISTTKSLYTLFSFILSL